MEWFISPCEKCGDVIIRRYYSYYAAASQYSKKIEISPFLELPWHFGFTFSQPLSLECFELPWFGICTARLTTGLHSGTGRASWHEEGNYSCLFLLKCNWSRNCVFLFWFLKKAHDWLLPLLAFCCHKRCLRLGKLQAAQILISEGPCQKEGACLQRELRK